jgi:hypothetical protein
MLPPGTGTIRREILKTNGDRLVVEAGRPQGIPLLTVRVWTNGKDGLRPSPRGFTLRLDRLNEFMSVLNQVRLEAIARLLCPGD